MAVYSRARVNHMDSGSLEVSQPNADAPHRLGIEVANNESTWLVL